jgi:hypothetical protein
MLAGSAPDYVRMPPSTDLKLGYQISDFGHDRASVVSARLYYAQREHGAKSRAVPGEWHPHMPSALTKPCLPTGSPAVTRSTTRGTSDRGAPRRRVRARLKCHRLCKVEMAPHWLGGGRARSLCVAQRPIDARYRRALESAPVVYRASVSSLGS